MGSSGGQIHNLNAVLSCEVAIHGINKSEALEGYGTVTDTEIQVSILFHATSQITSAFLTPRDSLHSVHSAKEMCFFLVYKCEKGQDIPSRQTKE